MVTINDKSRCSGCSACYSACPKHAITMVPDELGFKYPVVNKELCIECGLCVRVCSFSKPFLNECPKYVFAARNIDINEVKVSRSGAIFPALYKTIIEEKGVVYGAAFDGMLKVEHREARDVDVCATFKGSKYVQSEMGDTFNSVINELKKGNKVLFSGTPCQVSGLLSVVPANLQSDLFTVDIICHGVPSPQLYEDYLGYIEKKYYSKVKQFNFRDKSINGWHDHKESAILENGNSIVDTTFTKLFYTNCFFRDSCYSCPFACVKRVSDITLGDLWGWEKIDKSLNEDDMGVSLVIVNNEKGAHLFEKANANICIKQVELKKCMQRNLIKPTPLPYHRKELIKKYLSKGIENVINYLFYPTTSQRIIRKIKRIWIKL